MNKSNASAGLDQRKKDHIKLALDSQTLANANDKRFYYEPILSGHPAQHPIAKEFIIAGKKMRHPIWVSSMTGGTQFAKTINSRLALACKEFGLGMGLGSCRILLENKKYFKDFDVRKFIGDELPLFANLGIAQIESISQVNGWKTINQLIDQLKADGLIIHVNPLQEWLQPEGDRIVSSPINLIRLALEHIHFPIIVKEVGQGMGPQSLQALLSLPLEAIELAAFGGTNFSQLESKRNQKNLKSYIEPMSLIGHPADEMIEFINAIIHHQKNTIHVKSIVISGGIKDYLDGYYLMNKLNWPSIYGQASSFLIPAKKGMKQLNEYILSQIKGLQIAQTYLKVR